MFYLTDHSLEEAFQFSSLTCLDKQMNEMFSQKPQNPRQVWKSFFFCFTWQVKTVRHAKWPHCWKKKTNNKKKIIQLLGIYREDKKGRRIQEDRNGTFQTLRQKVASKNWEHNKTMNLSFNYITKTWNGVTIKEKK